MKVGIASDHAGTDLKSVVADFVKALEHEIIDYGVAADAGKSVDYPDYASLIAKDVAAAKLDRGILVCGTGIGMSMVANKFEGVRAALVTDEFTARMSRAHNDANILCIGSRVLNQYRATDYVKLWLETEFEGGRHQMRLNKVKEIEKALR